MEMVINLTYIPADKYKTFCIIVFHYVSNN